MRLPHTVDLSRGRPPEEFYTCLIRDPKKVEAWRASPEALDFSIPSSNWCAMTCLRMLLLLHNKQAPSLDELFERACGAGVYNLKEDGTWAGAHHEPLARFVDQFGFTTNSLHNMHTWSLAMALAEGQYAIASVSPDIRYPANTKEPEKKSGHLVLVYGYRTIQDQIYFLIQNSAGFASLESQMGVCILHRRMQQVFSGRALFVRPH